LNNARLAPNFHHNHVHHPLTKICSYHFYSDSPIKSKHQMTYGFRLNIEDIFFQLAEQQYQVASSHATNVTDYSPDGDKDMSFRGYPTDEGLAAAAVAIVGWATALEAFTNLAWNTTVATTLPAGKIQNMLIKHLSTQEKLGEVLHFFEIDLGQLTWWPKIEELFKLRNEFVHYKHKVEYQGFGYASSITKRISEKSVNDVRNSAIKAIQELGKLCNLRTGFIDGNYEIVTIDE
jgi:hypothetical protein